MASIRAPQHTTLRWQLTATHLAVTGLVLLLLQALSAGLVVAGLVASGRPLDVSLAAVGPGLPGMLLLSTLLFLIGGSVTALLYGQIASTAFWKSVGSLTKDHRPKTNCSGCCSALVFRPWSLVPTPRELLA
jgi:hypothetical protein